MKPQLTPDYYDYVFNGVKIDPYRILEVYEVHHPALQHAIKKLLRSGRKEGQSIIDDVRESISALQRYLEMMEEESD